VLSNRISHSISNQYEQRFSLTPAEWRVIAVLGEESGLSAGQVAKRTAMDKVAISRAVNNLITVGRLERFFSEHDKRRSILTLSEEGRDVYEQVVPLALSYEATLLQELTEKEQDFLDLVMAKLNVIQQHAERPATG